MRMQSTAADCGSTSLRNALFAIGKKRSLEEIELLCGTDAVQGTYTIQLIAAIDTIAGCKAKVISEKSEQVAWYMLTEALRAGRSAVLCVDSDEHYVAAIGLLGERIVIADSAMMELVITYKQRQLAKRWGPDYWGVIL
jgi:ABC-type bacteriocin/lantibiotic exporter with double-glycine peptidase domain